MDHAGYGRRNGSPACQGPLITQHTQAARRCSRHTRHQRWAKGETGNPPECGFLLLHSRRYLPAFLIFDPTALAAYLFW
ncbi:hypothetical protein SAMN00790413_04560 [Deinococcus hopiensis KR-140]|uniref:Uncharacterized protein n=1 Tax=Deinococcus hopiensis KR-140 TaxID=695939 RepID=A0A1W1UJZ2_9DEIO|nr:hypothetical protein SAMN00790413_04560 [Deinococcus hopiensis KR-140]